MRAFLRLPESRKSILPGRRSDGLRAAALFMAAAAPLAVRACRVHCMGSLRQSVVVSPGKLMLPSSESEPPARTTELRSNPKGPFLSRLAPQCPATRAGPMGAVLSPLALWSSSGCRLPVYTAAMRCSILVMRPRHSGRWCQALRINLARRQRMFASMLIPALPEMARASHGLVLVHHGIGCAPLQFAQGAAVDWRGFNAVEAHGVALADHEPPALRGWYGNPLGVVHDDGCVVGSLVEGGS